MSREHAQNTMGQLISESAQRDAIHIALAPVQAKERLEPGEHVDQHGFLDDKNPAVGIVDPFLRKSVKKGEWFWLFLYPNTITGLSHRWSHPAFDEAEERKPADDKAKSEAWLREFCATADCPGYETVIARAIDNRDSFDPEEYLHFDGYDAHGPIPPEFWDHVQVVTGEKIEPERRAKHFSCSC